MLRRNVERFEIVIIVLDLRAIDDAVTGGRENLLDTLERLTHRMQSARGLSPPRQRDIERLALECGMQSLRTQCRFARIEPTL